MMGSEANESERRVSRTFADTNQVGIYDKER